MSAVFLDTVGIIALLDKRDQWHAVAESAWTRVLAADSDLLTTSLILAECANAAARRPYRGAVAELRGALTDAGVVIEPSRDDWDEAWRNYARGETASASVIDHLSFLVMHRHRIIQAFTNDRHFLAAGCEVLF